MVLVVGWFGVDPCLGHLESWCDPNPVVNISKVARRE